MPGIFKKTMAYLGLVEDDYDDYGDYEPRAQAPVASSRVAEVEEPPPAVPATGTIRTLMRDESPRPAVVRPLPSEPAAPKVHVAAPTEFADARQIADRLVAGQPVIVNLQVADRELMRRMIDFCSGVTYASGGKMERVADKVFLVTPSNVKVSAEERQRLQQNGLLRG
ncbi:MAG: cell division protein SepF [Actinomycetota bacterium]|jgi:cell division inhibitor SepF|nr:cell division protein SepF [Actinomycetota bacterium]